VSDLTLLSFGVVVTFIACAGGYVMLRERFLHGVEEPGEAEPPRRAQPVPVQVVLDTGTTRRAAG
jgi:hypothetical protein